jgi:protein disulfide-isomerase A6
MDPAYEKLAVKYQHQEVTIARIDSYTHKGIGDKYQIEGWPTLKFFDGGGGEPVQFPWMWNVEMMSRFLDEQMAKLSAQASAPPPVPMASRPVF